MALSEGMTLGIAGLAMKGLTSLAGGLFGLSEQDKQFEYSKELAKYQNDLNVENWKMQNEYNLPRNQMQRLREAGLNPNLVYGSGASTTASSVPGVQRLNNPAQLDWSRILSPAGDAISTFLDNQAKVAEIENKEQSTANLKTYQTQMETNTQLTELKIIAQNLDNAKTSVERDMWRDIMESKLYLLDMQGVLAFSSAELNDAKRSYTNANEDYLENVKTPLDRSKTQFNYAQIVFLEYKKAKIENEIAVGLSQIGVNNETARLIGAKITNEWQDSLIKGEVITSKQLENQLTQMLIDNGYNARGGSYIDAIRRLVQGTFNGIERYFK